MNGDALLKPSRLAKNLSLGLLSLGLSLPCIGWGQFCGQNHASAVRNIHASTRGLAGEKPRLVMVGSSTIRTWPSPDTAFSQFDVVNAGFGGSCFSDLWMLRDTLIYALQPEVLMIYEGDNDLVDGVPEHDILATAEQLLHELSARLPQTAVVVVAPKASPARYHLAPAYLNLNEGLKQVAERHGAVWVDCWDAQHMDTGAVRDDLFVADGVHFNSQGYAVWVRELKRQAPWLDPNR